MLYDDFLGDSLDTSKWLVAHKNWGGKDKETGLDYNGGVVPENIEVKEGKLILTGHGNYYDGNVLGINKDQSIRADSKRVGAAIATRDYFGSGSYEVKAKVAPDFGACSAIWTFEYEEYYPGDDKYAELQKGGSYYAVNHEIDIEMPGRPNSEHDNQSFEYALCNTWIGEKGDTEPNETYPYDGWQKGTLIEKKKVGNLVKNSDFSKGEESWKLSGGTKIENNKAILASGSNTDSISQVIDVIGTETYRLTAKVNTVGAEIEIGVSDYDGRYTNINRKVTESGVITFDFSVVFYIKQIKIYGQVLRYQKNSEDCEIEYITLIPLLEELENPEDPGKVEPEKPKEDEEENDNIILNGDFSKGTEYWELTGSAKIENNKAVLASGKDTDEVRQKVNVISGLTYKLSADVVTSGAEVEILVEDYNGRYTKLNKIVNEEGEVELGFTVALHIKQITIVARVLRYQDNTEDCFIDNFRLVENKLRS